MQIETFTTNLAERRVLPSIFFIICVNKNSLNYNHMRKKKDILLLKTGYYNKIMLYYNKTYYNKKVTGIKIRQKQKKILSS